MGLMKETVRWGQYRKGSHRTGILFWRQGLSMYPGCPRMHSVDHAGLKLLPLPPQVLGGTKGSYYHAPNEQVWTFLWVFLPPRSSG